MKNKIIKILVWLIDKLEDEPLPAIEIYSVRDKVILPDYLSGKIISMRINFKEPVLPAKVIENIDSGSDIKNLLPDRTFILYHEEYYEK